LDGFSQLSVSFSSEVGTVLNFFASFFGSSQKMKWGFRGEAPIDPMWIIKQIIRKQNTDMSKITIQLTGVSAELALGNYMPKDTTIFNNWEDFYHYNDLIHVSQLLVEHISEIQISKDGEVVFSGQISPAHLHSQKSISPVLQHRALYLRTECAEQAVYSCEFEAEAFDKNRLSFETQDYDHLFKVGTSFLSKVLYDGQEIKPEWISGKPVGNICVLCRFENGYLVPLYDAVNKIAAQ
jgi:hypothetical protein